MKTKKSKRANLENYRTIFLQIGIILTLSAILFAFEWKTKANLEKLEYNTTSSIDIEDLPPVTRPKAEEIRKIEAPSFEIVPDIKEDVPDFNPEKFISEIEDDVIFDIPEIREPEEVDETVIIAEFMPTFQGKDIGNFRNYIANNVKFPATAVDHGISGTVFVAFVVDKDGTICNVELLRKVHPIIDQAVLKVIENSPKWEPGINNGRYVRVKFTIAIKFNLVKSI
ncbi:MAG: hypothetical protein C0597_17325 [Marinilabiliales bacterium]|nr:MAG: hypothetical protein C0597_17325 [Marinilabiliales bacterium]